jgi:hypothetical protein
MLMLNWRDVIGRQDCIDIGQLPDVSLRTVRQHM